MDVAEVASDLTAEQQSLDEIVSSLTPEQWGLPTSSPRWNVADQIAHLRYFDCAAATAIVDQTEFQKMVGELMEAAAGGEEGADSFTLGAYRNLPSDELLEAWRDGRKELGRAASSLSNETRIEWYGPSMGSKSFLTARLMEVWAHGQDIVDTVGATRPATDRLSHIARLGFITRSWTYINRREEVPNIDIKLRLNAPSGAVWEFGPDDAVEEVHGNAEDFCLVVTQRRHLDDTELVANGAAARDWLLKSQAYAGPASDGPTPGSR